jgi:hypothetical protein
MSFSGGVFTKGLYLGPYFVGQFVEKQEQLLQEVLKGLDRDSHAALGRGAVHHLGTQDFAPDRRTEGSALDRFTEDRCPV